MLLRLFLRTLSRHHFFTQMLPRQKLLPSCQALRVGMAALCCPGRLIHHRLLIVRFPEPRDVMQVHPGTKGEMGAMCTAALALPPSDLQQASPHPTLVFPIAGSQPLQAEVPFICLIMQKEKESEVAQSCLILCDPTDCGLPGSSIHGTFQARVLEWVAISFSRGSSRCRD